MHVRSNASSPDVRWPAVAYAASMLRWVLDRKWTIIMAISALAVHVLLPDSAAIALSRDALGNGRVWTLLTGSLLHVSDRHLSMDVLGLLLVGCIFEPRLAPLWPWLIAAINMVVGVLVLALYPSLPGYCGLSALDQGLLAAGVVSLAFDRRTRNAAWVVGVTLILKWTFEIVGGMPMMGAVASDPLTYGQPVPWAHAIGGITGAAMTAISRLASKVTPTRCRLQTEA